MMLAILNVMYNKYFTAFSNVSCKTSIQDCLRHFKGTLYVGPCTV